MADVFPTQLLQVDLNDWAIAAAAGRIPGSYNCVAMTLLTFGFFDVEGAERMTHYVQTEGQSFDTLLSQLSALARREIRFDLHTTPLTGEWLNNLFAHILPNYGIPIQVGRRDELAHMFVFAKAADGQPTIVDSQQIVLAVGVENVLAYLRHFWPGGALDRGELVTYTILSNIPFNNQAELDARIAQMRANVPIVTAAFIDWLGMHINAPEPAAAANAGAMNLEGGRSKRSKRNTRNRKTRRGRNRKTRRGQKRT